jgi:hypothetical protein
MKAEINNENKAKFFALYYGQEIIMKRVWDSPMDFKYLFQDDLEYNVASTYLKLKPLSQITDEDAIEVECYGAGVDEYGYSFSRVGHTSWKGHEQDYLRSKGYALPWMGLTVDELVKAGWVTLTEK